MPGKTTVKRGPFEAKQPPPTTKMRLVELVIVPTKARVGPVCSLVDFARRDGFIGAVLKLAVSFNLLVQHVGMVPH